MKFLHLLAVLYFAAALSAGQSMPAIKGKALDNSEVSLPAAGGQQILILIVGFSQKSGKLCEVWSKAVSADYRADSRVAYFSLPVLEDAPSLFRPLIVRGMRKGVPADEQRRFVPIYSNEPEWKTFVHFTAPDDAYLVVAGADGHPVWQAHGAYSDAGYRDLKAAVADLLKKSSSSNPPR